MNEETRSRIDKSLLALPEAKRLRDKQHLRFVALPTTMTFVPFWSMRLTLITATSVAGEIGSASPGWMVRRGR